MKLRDASSEVKPSSAKLQKVAKDLAIVARYLDDFSPCIEKEINIEKTMPAASVIKLGIMSYLLHQASSGAISMQEEIEVNQEDFVQGAGILFELRPRRKYSLKELCRLMMVVSDNTASNVLVKRLGRQSLNDFWLKRKYQARLNRLFMHPVLNGLDNEISALGCARLLQDLYQGYELTSALKDFAIDTLRNQQYREKIPLMLPESTPIGHKTGELDGVRHDAAVIELERPYILVVLTSQGREPWHVDRAIAEYSLALYQKLSKTI